ncbi:M28 family peptidase [Archangium violaceum]|uniref:M28 family peptidase n=1 Tax=Archangium violaceum TaxID=83451 RepID=UPI0019507F7D|nr:M28 family peptidase [Archangium violaceum]QRN95174.1 M28 family peptidase [Archangium violaceum]
MKRLACKLLAVSLALLGVTCTPRTLEGADLARLEELVAQVDQERLMRHVDELVKAHLEDTPLPCSVWDDEHFPALCSLTRDRAGQMMVDSLGSHGLKVSRQIAEGGGWSSSNVIAELPGVSKPEEVVLVGAHFDAYFGGADDNSSGVAAVLELARVLSQYRFDRTVRFVGFDLEEVGLVGSNRYVDTLGGERLVASVVFDCIGYYDSRPGSQGSLPGLPAPNTGDFLAAFANEDSRQQATDLYALSQALHLINVVPVVSPGRGAYPLTGNLLRSDHAPFWFTGRNALFLTDTANFRNPNYHWESDLPPTLDPVSFRKAVQVSAAALAYWAGGPR